MRAIVSNGDGTNPQPRDLPLEFDAERRVVHLRGGPTGYESLYLDDWLRPKDGRDGWLACAGTPGSWRRCFVPQEEMDRALEELGAVTTLDHPYADELHLGGQG